MTGLFTALEPKRPDSIVRPKSFKLVLTAQTAIAHGDAGANATGVNNTTLFCRELTAIEAKDFSASPKEVR